MHVCLHVSTYVCGCMFACVTMHLKGQVVWKNICSIKVEGKNTGVERIEVVGGWRVPKFYSNLFAHFS